VDAKNSIQSHTTAGSGYLQPFLREVHRRILRLASMINELMVVIRHGAHNSRALQKGTTTLVVVQFQNCDCFLLGGKEVFNAKYAKDSRRAQRKAPDEHKLNH
jgi:hypothetical protein